MREGYFDMFYKKHLKRFHEMPSSPKKEEIDKNMLYIKEIHIKL